MILFTTPIRLSFIVISAFLFSMILGSGCNNNSIVYDFAQHETTPNPISYDTLFYSDVNYDFDGGISILNNELNAVETFTDVPIAPQGTSTVEGVVTMQSNWYFKTGMPPTKGQNEKNYGCFFIQDQNSGIFVINASDALHEARFGERVSLTVNTMVRSYDFNFVSSYKKNDIAYPDYSMYYQIPTAILGEPHVSKVVRVTGAVNEILEFGEFHVISGDLVSKDLVFTGGVSLDLQDRHFVLEVGDRIQMTGPVLFSYGVYKICLDHESQVVFLN